uniref:Uncharacterized protein n=1 Tax=Anguilla anguilla TaxID=7936 RepID=A0A0E9SN27_ANGAN
MCQNVWNKIERALCLLNVHTDNYAFPLKRSTVCRYKERLIVFIKTPVCLLPILKTLHLCHCAVHKG